jgi:predicted nucleic acid-binding protein
MDDGRRRTALAAWLAINLPAGFAERILPIDHAVAEHRGDLMAQSPRSGVALSVMDGFLAATAVAKDLTLVTRNVGFYVIRRAAVQSVGRIRPTKW